ncbi:MAG: PDZ domain-containing protein [Planctomycetes bacterium]|nr:PDZ domain-containing protein [Planctomycetota bacterium]
MITTSNVPAALADLLEPDASPNPEIAVKVDIVFPRGGDLPVINVNGFGTTLRFLVDTTHFTTVLDVKWRRKMKAIAKNGFKPFSRQTEDGDEEYVTPDIRLATMQIDLPKVKVADLSEYNKLLDEPIDGCLGMDVLQNYIMSLDCVRGVLCIYTRLPKNVGEEVKLERTRHGIPAVRLTIADSKDILCGICTDSPVALLLTPDCLSRLLSKDAIRFINPSINVADLSTSNASGLASDVTLGSYVAQNVVVNGAEANWIGMKYLARFIVTFDFPRNKAYFRTSQFFDRSDQLDCSGLVLAKRGQKVLIEFVMSNSPGCESGILDGDVLYTVDNRPTASLTLFEIRQLFCVPGRTVQIDVARGPRILRNQLRLRNYSDVWDDGFKNAGKGNRPGTDSSATPLAEIDIEKYGAPIVIPVHIDKCVRPLRMLVDTGAARTVMGSHLREKLGESVGQRLGITVDGSRLMEQVRIGGVVIAGVKMSDASVVAVDKSVRSFGELIGEELLDGFLGIDLLRQYVVQVDFDQGKLRLYSGVCSGAGESVPLVYRPSGAPAILATLGNDHKQWFIADTGCVSWNFSDDALLSALNSGGIAKEFHRGVALYNSPLFVRKRWRVNQTCVGPFLHRDLGFVGAHTNALGLNYFSRFLTTFDFRGRALYLKKGERFDKTDFFDASGLNFMKRNGQYVVHSITPGSPASEIDIQNGDVIVHIDGVDATKKTMFEIQEMFSKAGSSVIVTVQRHRAVFERRIALSIF